MGSTVTAVFLLLVSIAAATEDATFVLQTHVQSLRTEGDVPGINAAVRTRDGRVVTASAGFADLEQHIPLTPGTLMPGGSTGKTFVACVAMQLVHEKRLDLEAPLSTWFGDEPWFDGLPNAREITLAMLLTHTSGLPDHVDDLGFALDVAWRRLKGNGNPIAPRELIQFLVGDEPLFRAGSAYSYTDTGYILVGMIIERVTGHAYYDELRARLLEPLHLDDVVPAIAPRSQPIAAGYVAPTLLTVATGLVGKLTDEKGTITQILHTEWTGGGLFTTPTMLVRFYGELVEGHVVSPAAFRTMVAAAQGQERPYGYGIFVFDDPALGRWIGHGGWFPGYRTAVVHYIEHGITVALQANTDRRDVDLFNSAAHVAGAVIKPTD